MAATSTTPTMPDEATLERRTDAIIEALDGPLWIGPLSEAEGAKLGRRVLARALAPYFKAVPGFNWAGSGSLHGVSFPNCTTYSDRFSLQALREIRLFLTPVGRTYDGLNEPVLVIGLRHTEPPCTAEVFAEVEDLRPDTKDPLGAGWKRRLLLVLASVLHLELADEMFEGPERLTVDRIRVDVGSPVALTLFREQVPGRTRLYPMSAPVTTVAGSTGAADKMGEFLADLLAKQYGLVPVPT